MRINEETATKMNSCQTEIKRIRANEDEKTKIEIYKKILSTESEEDLRKKALENSQRTALTKQRLGNEMDLVMSQNSNTVPAPFVEIAASIDRLVEIHQDFMSLQTEAHLHSIQQAAWADLKAKTREYDQKDPIDWKKEKDELMKQQDRVEELEAKEQEKPNRMLNYEVQMKARCEGLKLKKGEVHSELVYLEPCKTSSYEESKKHLSALMERTTYTHKWLLVHADGQLFAHLMKMKEENKEK
jgi:hypothetical protein